MSVNWWVDIENASGTVQGDGPLQPTRWRSTRRLNKAGTFEFEIPATDTRAANLIQQKYIARCYAVIGGATVEVGAGIIEEITLRLDNNVPVRVVRGPDLLSELRRVLVDKRTGLGLTTYFNLPTFVNDDEVPPPNIVYCFCVKGTIISLYTPNLFVGVKDEPSTLYVGLPKFKFKVVLVEF